MKTTFEQKDIESALITFARTSGINRQVLSIDFKITRKNGAGLTALIEFGDPLDNEPKAYAATTQPSVSDEAMVHISEADKTPVQLADAVVTTTGDIVNNTQGVDSVAIRELTQKPEPATSANTQPVEPALNTENIFLQGGNA